MLKLISSHKDHVKEWVCRELDINIPGKFTSVGIMCDDELIGGYVFHHYDGNSMEISLASISPKWCSRKVLRQIFKYAFEAVQVVRFQAQCKRSNKKIRSVLERLGFKLEGVLRKAFKGTEDVFMYSMLKNECRWL